VGEGAILMGGFNSWKSYSKIPGPDFGGTERFWRGTNVCLNHPFKCSAVVRERVQLNQNDRPFPHGSGQVRRGQRPCRAWSRSAAFPCSPGSHQDSHILPGCARLLSCHSQHQPVATTLLRKIRNGPYVTRCKMSGDARRMK